MYKLSQEHQDILSNYTFDASTHHFRPGEQYMPPQYFCGPTPPATGDDSINWDCPVFWHDTSRGVVNKWCSQSGWDIDYAMPRIVADLESGEVIGTIVSLFQPDVDIGTSNNSRVFTAPREPVKVYPTVEPRSLKDILDY